MTPPANKLPKKARRSNPILVTGSHRSGSTWAGQMLAASPGVGYIHEPFNSEIRISVTPQPFKYMFQYVSEEDSEDYRSAIDGIIKNKYPLSSNLVKARTLMDAADIAKGQALYWSYKLRKARLLIKDPIAIFSAEWLHRNFDMDILVMLRHPAAFCSSLKIKRWEFDFNYLLNQPLLIERYLDKYREEISEFAKSKKSIIEQAILLWNCIHHTISIYRERYPEWLFVRHEDLSLDPINRFRSIYAALGLEFTPRVEAKILERSGVHNPVEQQAGDEFKRDAKNNIKNWKNRLTRAEIEFIKMQTSEVSTLFYSAEAW